MPEPDKVQARARTDSAQAAEKLLLKLRRLPANRICPNCLREDPVGFTAICVPFKTFVCSECKSAHQSFSHRVKSSSQSTWSMEEVKALDEKNGGGNRLAMELWLATMPESARPGKDASLEAIKRFVDHAYNEERWKAKEPPIPQATGTQERRPKDKDRKKRNRLDSGTSGGTMDMLPSGESRSTSRASSPKQRGHNRRDVTNGWSATDFPPGGWGAADFGNSSTPGGDGWGASITSPALPGHQCMPPSTPNSEPFVSPQMHNMPPLTPNSEVYLGPNMAPSTPGSEAYMADANMAGQMWGQSQWNPHHQAQNTPAYSQEATPYDSPAINGANGHFSWQPPYITSPAAQGMPMRPPLQQPLSPAPSMMAANAVPFRLAELPWDSASAMRPSAAKASGAVGSTDRARNMAPSTPGSAGGGTRLATAFPSSSKVSAVRVPGGKDTMTLHPTNPWADDMSAKLIQIQPTNPWADVVPRTLIAAQS